jgi:hypothetical protein
MLSRSGTTTSPSRSSQCAPARGRYSHALLARSTSRAPPTIGAKEYALAACTKPLPARAASPAPTWRLGLPASQRDVPFASGRSSFVLTPSTTMRVPIALELRRPVTICPGRHHSSTPPGSRRNAADRQGSDSGRGPTHGPHTISETRPRRSPRPSLGLPRRHPIRRPLLHLHRHAVREHPFRAVAEGRHDALAQLRARRIWQAATASLRRLGRLRRRGLLACRPSPWTCCR